MGEGGGLPRGHGGWPDTPCPHWTDDLTAWEEHPARWAGPCPGSRRRRMAMLAPEGRMGLDEAFCGWRGLKPTRRGRRSARGPPPRRGAARGPADVPGRQAARLVGSSSWPPPGRAPPSWTSPSSLLAEECDPVTPHRPANSEVQRQVRTISVIFLPLGYMLIQVDFFFKKLPSRALKINRIFR